MRRYPPLEFDIDKCCLFPPDWGLDECGTPPCADPWPRPRLGDLCLFCVGELPRPRPGDDDDDDDEAERERERPGRPGVCDRLRFERVCVRALAGASATAGTDTDDGENNDANDGAGGGDDDDEDGVGVCVGGGVGVGVGVGCEANARESTTSGTSCISRRHTKSVSGPLHVGSTRNTSIPSSSNSPVAGSY